MIDQDLTILTKWKFQTRNKIETSKIEDQVKLFVEYPDEKIATMATEASPLFLSPPSTAQGS